MTEQEQIDILRERLDMIDERLRRVEELIRTVDDMSRTQQRLLDEFVNHTKDDINNFREIRDILIEIRTSYRSLNWILGALATPVIAYVIILVVKTILGMPL